MPQLPIRRQDLAADARIAENGHHLAPFSAITDVVSRRLEGELRDLGLGHHMGLNLFNTGNPTHGGVGIRFGVKRALDGDAVDTLARPPGQSISKIGSITPHPAPLVGARAIQMYEKGSASCPKQMNTGAMPMRPCDGLPR
jgi:hypothetical protein